MPWICLKNEAMELVHGRHGIHYFIDPYNSKFRYSHVTIRKFRSCDILVLISQLNHFGYPEVRPINEQQPQPKCRDFHSYASRWTGRARDVQRLRSRDFMTDGKRKLRLLSVLLCNITLNTVRYARVAKT